MAGSVTELLTQALPLLAIGAGQTLAISLLAILFATLGGVAYGVLAQQGGRLTRGVLRV
ncbi:amino acid ABC transporter permease, partial [Aeromonas allosaccharophila]